jgi:Putative Actinobacterial Holin-X, holin superfamily III
MDDQAMIDLRLDEKAAPVTGRETGPNGENGRTGSDMRAGGDMVMKGVAGFGENLLTLAELQARLAKIELGQNLEAARAGVVLALGSALTACSGVIIMLAGLAELMVSELGIKRGYALLSVGCSAIAVGAICLVVAAAWLRAKRLGFPLSCEELVRNFNWLKAVLRHSGRSRR